MRLTARDKLIIEVLQNQEFCFYKDICKNFFPSKSSASQSLKRLMQSGHIILEPAEKLNSHSFDDLSLSLFINNHFIVRLGDRHKLIKRETSSWRRKHQILLFSIKERLESLLKEEAVFEIQIRELRNTLHNGKYEPLPDFFIKGESYKLAVELELNLKTQNRYFQKMIDYRNSRFTHVLYVATHIKSLQRLAGTFRHRKYIAISHYSNVKEVISHRYGRQTLIQWLKEETK